jgi:protein SCO1/2
MKKNRPALHWLVPGVLILALGLVAVAWLTFEARRADRPFHGTAYDPPAPAPAFSLTDHTGQPVALGDYRGAPVLLFFGFTSCPDVCPLTLSKLGRVTSSLGQDSADVRIVLVTVDPARDTPETLARYVRRFGPRVTGLTGDADTLRQLRAAYGVYAGPPAADATHTGMAHSEMAHTDAVYGIDRQGQIRVLMHPDAPEEQIREDVRTLLAL